MPGVRSLTKQALYISLMASPYNIEVTMICEYFNQLTRKPSCSLLSSLAVAVTPKVISGTSWKPLATMARLISPA